MRIHDILNEPDYQTKEQSMKALHAGRCELNIQSTHLCIKIPSRHKQQHKRAEFGLISKYTPDPLHHHQSCYRALFFSEWCSCSTELNGGSMSHDRMTKFIGSCRSSKDTFDKKPWKLMFCIFFKLWLLLIFSSFCQYLAYKWRFFSFIFFCGILVTKDIFYYHLMSENI